jgi:hypothetical protein
MFNAILFLLFGCCFVDCLINSRSALAAGKFLSSPRTQSVRRLQQPERLQAFSPGLSEAIPWVKIPNVFRALKGREAGARKLMQPFQG